jgi:hypothetical protein
MNGNDNNTKGTTMTKITTANFRFYVAIDGENVATFRFLKDAVRAYPDAVLDVPETVRKAFEISQHSN